MNNGKTMELRVDSLTSLHKNAISSLMEYGQARGRVVNFEEKAGHTRVPGCRFCIAVEYGGSDIAEGYGSSKKDAKLQAAERALRILYGSNNGTHAQQTVVRNRSPIHRSSDDSDESDETSPVPGKDPVSSFMEFAQGRRMQPRFEYLDKEGPSHCPTFTARAYLNDRGFPEAMSNNKKDAKKKAALRALKELVKEGAIDTKDLVTHQGNGQSCAELGREYEGLCPPHTNPVSVINEFAQKQGYSIEIKELRSSGPTHKPCFDIAVVLNGEQFPVAQCENKKTGKRQAALLALKELKSRGVYFAESTNGQSGQSMLQTVTVQTFEDKMAAMCHKKFDDVVTNLPENLAGRKVLAGIVMRDDILEQSEVVSLASGNRCITGEALNVEGTVLNDSHAEIIARRGLCRYLFDQLWRKMQGGKDHILIQSGTSLCVRPGISFHLYISTAPCGDGALFTHSDPGSNAKAPAGSHCPIFHNDKQGQLRTKVEKGEGTIPIEDEDERQTLDGIRGGERLRTMSCSDKIMRWNVLGVQGALLANLLNPVYLSSITLGNLYNQGHLSRAVCCRVDRKPLTGLPKGYRVNHPQLGAVTACNLQRSTDKSRPVSINWNSVDNTVEVTDGTTGQIHKDEPQTIYARFRNHRGSSVKAKYSRLCKKEMFERYKQLMEVYSKKDYSSTKKSSLDYQRAKQTLIDHLRQSRYGSWLSKPKECDKFL